MKKQTQKALHKTRLIGRGIRKAGQAAKRQLSPMRDFVYHIDRPAAHIIDDRELIVDGWVLSLKNRPYSIRVKNNGTEQKVTREIRRIDVAYSHPTVPKEQTLTCGFRAEFPFEDGLVTVEIDSGNGFTEVFRKRVEYGVERLVADVYNGKLAKNYAEHTVLLDNKKNIYHESASKKSFKRHPADPRLVATYLPQFHPFPENNTAWGKGFTEWTNVTAAAPRFVGHQQPVLPADLGFYDLRHEDNIAEQIALARKYGLHGFCFYYYWFSGKKLMDGPIDAFLKHKEWDFNFTICWANENWTKRWDGRDDDVIIAQQYRSEDPLAFIQDVEHILNDPRYIQEDGKPVLMVYRASDLKDPAEYAQVWRQYFRKVHKKELHLVSFLSFDVEDPRVYGFDMALDFAPQSGFFKKTAFENDKYPFTNVESKLLDSNFQGQTADYRKIALNDNIHDHFDFPVYPCVTPSWDNDARKKGKGFVFEYNSPDLYAEWLGKTLDRVSDKDQPLIFINAWNEWAEGAILEPTAHYGHAVLRRTAEMLALHSKNKVNAQNFPLFDIKKRPDSTVAVLLHMYYVEQWPYLQEKLRLLKDKGVDLHVTLNIKNKDFQQAIINFDSNAQVYIVPNRGRDVLPFVHIGRRLERAGYQGILKLHAKRSRHRTDGVDWFKGLVDALLPNQKVVDEILSNIAGNEPVFIGAADHFVSLERYMGGNAGHISSVLTELYGERAAQRIVKDAGTTGYFAGTMFWASFSVLRPLLGYHFMPEDFAAESGQIDGTLAHAIERLITIVANQEGATILQIKDQELTPVTNANATKNYKFAP